MKNIDRIANYVTKHGSESIMIHTIPGTNNWIICQKIEKDKWTLTMGDPMGNVTYNLGMVTADQHLELWTEIVNMNIENKASSILQAKQVTNRINNFKKNYADNYKIYKKFTKTEENKKVSTIDQTKKYKTIIKNKIKKYQEKNKQTEIKTSNKHDRSYNAHH